MRHRRSLDGPPSSVCVAVLVAPSGLAEVAGVLRRLPRSPIPVRRAWRAHVHVARHLVVGRRRRRTSSRSLIGLLAGLRYPAAGPARGRAARADHVARPGRGPAGRGAGRRARPRRRRPRCASAAGSPATCTTCWPTAWPACRCSCRRPARSPPASRSPRRGARAAGQGGRAGPGRPDRGPGRGRRAARPGRARAGRAPGPGRAASRATATLHDRRRRPVPVPAEAGHAVYRAVQESLTNAARYAPGAPSR